MTPGQALTSLPEDCVIVPRPYQVEAADAAYRETVSRKSCLILMATGTGKSITIGMISARSSGRTLVIVNREHLVWQDVRACRSVLGDHAVQVEMAGNRADLTRTMFGETRVVVASVQSLSQPRRLGRFKPTDFENVVVDEAHFGVQKNPTYNAVVRHFDGCRRRVGLTAAGDRGDNESLSPFFEHVAFRYNILDAYADGYLVRPVQKFVRITDLDVSAVRRTRGHRDRADLEFALSTKAALAKIAQPTYDLANCRGERRPTLVVCSGVRQSHLMAAVFNEIERGSAVALDGTTDPGLIEAAKADHAAGRFQFLVGCDLFLYGWDAPYLRCLAVARPVGSRSLYEQIMGRVVRPLPGVVDAGNTADERRAAILASKKPGGLVLDFVGNGDRHSLVCSADVLAGRVSPASLAAVKDKFRNSGDFADMYEEMRRLRGEKAAADAAALTRVSVAVTYTTEDTDPFVRRLPAERRGAGLSRRKRLANPRVLAVLKRNGFETANLSAADVDRHMREIARRRKLGLCTVRMARLLASKGLDPDTDMAEAKAAIDAIQANGWEVPERLREAQAPPPASGVAAAGPMGLADYPCPVLPGQQIDEDDG
jgi:superfamily II DNA or RNA helicase